LCLYWHVDRPLFYLNQDDKITYKHGEAGYVYSCKTVCDCRRDHTYMYKCNII